MIKCDLHPISCVVAIRTFRAKAFFVDVVLYVTGDARTGSVPTLVVRFVTVSARRFQVFAKQLKIGEDVVECLFIQPENVSVSAFMFGVAGRAVIRSGIIEFSVKTCTIGDIAGDIVVTIKAERFLLRSIECPVTGRTL